MRLLCLIGVASLLAAPVSAADKDAARERKVKVALALAEANPAPKDDARTAKVAAALEAAGFPSPAPFVTIPTVAPAPMPREVLPCDCLTEGLDSCPCGPGCRCRADAAKTDGSAVKIVKRPVWFTDYNAALKAAQPGQTVVVLFTDPVNCVPCKLLEAGAFSDPAVRDALLPCVCVRVDVTTPAGKAMLARFAAHGDKVDRWPALKVYRTGIRVADHVGNMTADTLLTLIR